MTVSVIIATYNRQQLLRRTVMQVVEQTPAPLEIIVVDQTPQSDIGAEVSSLSELVSYYRLPQPNLPAARNFGISKARGDVLLFIDDDVEISREFVSRHMRNYVDESVGGVAALVLSGKEHNLENALKTAECMFESEMPLEDKPVSVTWMSGVNMSYRRKVLINAGLFDERFTGSAWCEDADMSVRVRALGYKLLLDPRMRIVHLVEKAGGCGNRTADRLREGDEQRLRLYIFFVLKNRKVMGFCVVAKNLLRAFRMYVVSREIVHAGLRVALHKQIVYVSSIMRALRGCPLQPDNS